MAVSPWEYGSSAKLPAYPAAATPQSQFLSWKDRVETIKIMQFLAFFAIGSTGQSLEPDFLGMVEPEELLPWQHSSPAHVYTVFELGGIPGESSPPTSPRQGNRCLAHFTKAGKSLSTHR